MILKGNSGPGLGRVSLRSRGFTLLELLVSMTLLGMIATVAFGALRMGSRSWEAGLNKAEETAELRSVPGFLHRHLSQTLPLTWEEEGLPSRVAFEGGRDLVKFIAPAPQRHAGAGLYEFSLEVKQDADGKSLVLYYEPYLPGEDRFRISTNSERVILLEDLEEITFSYFGAENAKSREEWRNQWIKTAELLPRLVRLSLKTGEERERWPELLVVLRQAGG